MKKITIILIPILFLGFVANAQVVTLDKTKINTQQADPKMIEIEKRLAALEAENSALKKEVVNLKTKIDGSVFILNSGINKLTKNLADHTHSLNTRVKITGVTSFTPPNYGSPMLFAIGKVQDKDVETGGAIIKQ